MIKTRKDLKEYLSVEYYDFVNRGSKLKNKVLPPPNYLYIKILRKYEYYLNTGNKLMTLWYFYRMYRIRMRTGITIPCNTCGKGLTLYHHGSIVVNPATRIGANCCIMNNVNIGANQGSDKAPIIGNDVYIGPGAVIFGDISIADGCYIGANAVVNKSVDEPNSVIVGVPAKIIKTDSIHWWEKNKLIR